MNDLDTNTNFQNNQMIMMTTKTNIILLFTYLPLISLISFPTVVRSLERLLKFKDNESVSVRYFVYFCFL